MTQTKSTLNLDYHDIGRALVNYANMHGLECTGNVKLHATDPDRNGFGTFDATVELGPPERSQINANGPLGSARNSRSS
jgi:hypothetical protein